MLPLWILDITKQSDRRDKFQELIGQIDHVRMPKDDVHPLKDLYSKFDEAEDIDSKGYDNTEYAEGSEFSDPSSRDAVSTFGVDVDNDQTADASSENS